MRNLHFTSSIQANQTQVTAFEMTYLWPVRMSAQGDLGAARQNIERNSASWLNLYADVLGNGGNWKLVEDYYASPVKTERDGIDLPATPQLGTPAPSQGRYAEFLYFHPYIHSIFYEADEQRSAKILERVDIEQLRVVLRHGDKCPEWCLQVLEVKLFLFPTDIAILAVRVAEPRACDAAGNPIAFLLSDAMDFMDYTRRVYPPYWDDQSCSWGRVPVSMKWIRRNGTELGVSDFRSVNAFENKAKLHEVPVAAHWLSLLDGFQPAPSEGDAPVHGTEGAETTTSAGLLFSQVEDDRLPILAYLAVDEPAKISQGDWLRLAYCDDFGPWSDSNGFAYSKPFLEETTKGLFYDRFWDPDRGCTTRYSFVDYAFVVVGATRDGFFRKVVRSHFRQHYLVLALLAHLQKASLLGYWSDLSKMVQQFSQAPPSLDSKVKLDKAQQRLLNDLTDFVSRFYFIEVSNQLQAKEMFDLWRSRLGIEKLFAEVVEQSKFVAAVIADRRQSEIRVAEKRQQEAIGNLTAAAQYLLPPATAAAVVALFLAVPGVSEAMKFWASGSSMIVRWEPAMRAAGIGFVVLWGLGQLALYCTGKYMERKQRKEAKG